ncbi:hypothetical protein ACIRQQ_26650 [Streptomyces fuscichromogenes]|uniref:hypothetical protein n=1 Tax=Streptomyces fuscichromogenes TaxID=1324013 RepID=UPI00380D841F
MLIATNVQGHAVKQPSQPEIDTMLANLGQGDHLILERRDEGRAGDWYIQVLFRDDNTYQLEYRDGVPAEHYQTVTASQDKARQTLLDWAAETPDWRDGLVWNNIGAMFGALPVEATDQPTP